MIRKSLCILGLMVCGFMLDVIAYNASCSACEKAQDAKRAFQTIHAMQQHLMLDVIAYNALSRDCAKAQDGRAPSKPSTPRSSSASC